MQETSTPPIALIGLGYVGLPLAVEFGKRNHCYAKVSDVSLADLAQ